MKKIWMIGLIVVMGALGCRKDNVNTNIPHVPFNIQLNLDLPGYFDITAPGGWMYYNGVGSRGLIIYRYSLEEFRVYDRHSTYNIPAGCKIEVMDDNITVEDPCSDSSWIIIDGSVASGPAEVPLHTYHYTYNHPILQIVN